MPRLFNERGAVHLLLIVAAIGALAFIITASTADFKDKLFGRLYQRTPSKAASNPISIPVTPQPTPAGSFIKVTYPNGGENFIVGSKVRITWSSSQVVSCSIYGIKQVGYVLIANIANPTLGYYDWTVRSDLLGNQNKIGIRCKNSTGTTIYDLSDNFFSVINVPSLSSIKKVFVTKNLYNGNLGGLTGADQKCQSAATTANLGGTWKAWLSSSTVSASSRLTHHTGPYVILSGAVIAKNWTDLTDGTLASPINVTESREVLSSGQNGVWTNTDASGNIPTSNNASCNDWTSSQSKALAQSNALGRIGSNNQKDFGWTLANYPPILCANDSLLRLYCFEQ